MLFKQVASVYPLLLSLTLARPTPPPAPSSRTLTFDPHGQFKIAVFTDLHYGEAPDQDWGPQQDVNSTRVMSHVLQDENPDLVVFNGDQITGENTYAFNSTANLDAVFSATKSRGIPFACIMGNHDNAPNISHTAEYNYEKQHYADLSLTRANPSSAKDQNGIYNYYLEVFSKGGKVPSLLLWFFDSRSGIFDSPSQYQDWVDPQVATWLQQTSASLKQKYGGQLPPSMAFVHIPPEVAVGIQQSTVDPNPTKYGLNEDRPVDPQGQHHPEIKSPDAPFWNALTSSLGTGLIATVVGHDHGDNWCAKSADVPYNVCFAKHSGYGGYGSWTGGSRIFSFTQTKSTGKRPAPQPVQVDTWMRMEDHSTVNGSTLAY